jgi:hypothetical protein
MLYNLVSLCRLRKRGLWWDNQSDLTNLRRKDNTLFCHITEKFDQFVLEYQPPETPSTAFVTRRRKFNTYTERRLITLKAIKWHQRLGHPGPQALEHLVNCFKGVRIRGPITVECEARGISKAKRQIRREDRQILEGPGERLAIDFHDCEPRLDDYTSTILITDRWSSFIWDFYLQDRTAQSIITALDSLFGILDI